MKTEQQLLAIKKEMDETKPLISELTGQQKELLKQLKEEWTCKDTEQGDQEINKLLNRRKEIDQQIEDKSKELEEKYDV
jgi:hypothetical protein